MSEALRLAEIPSDYSSFTIKETQEAQAELRRLHAENEELRKAYRKMRNSAAGYSNFCEDSASTRRCERDYDEAEDIYRSTIN